MARSKTTLVKGKENLPGRGLSNKNRVLDGILASSRSNLASGSTRDQAEIAFFKLISDRAFDSEDKDSGMLLRFLGDKAYSSMKPTLGCVEFSFDPTATPSTQASQVMSAAAKGEIAPDIANTFISSIASMLKIDEVTELQSRIEALEKVMNA